MNIGMTQFYQYSLFCFLTLLLASCASNPAQRSTEYDGRWAGNLVCGAGKTYNYKYPPWNRPLTLTVQKSRITDMVFRIDGESAEDIIKIQDAFPRSYFIDDMHYRFDTTGYVQPDGDINLTSDFVMSSQRISLNLFGDFNGTGFELKGAYGNESFSKAQLYGVSCTLSLERDTTNPGLIMASQSAPLPSLNAINLEQFGRYHALVIGIDEYAGLPNLKSAIYDAKAIDSLLKYEYGFVTNLLINPTRDDIIRALSHYRNTLQHQDNLLIYYAGHGWLDSEADQGYWLPSDASRDDESNWYSNASLTSSLRAMPSKHVMVISDSCYSGKLVRGLKMSQGNSHYLEQLISKKARTVMTSGGLEPVMDKGGKNDHSVFASALIDALKQNDGVIEGSVLFSQVRRPVAVNSDQTPEYADIRKAGHDGGDFLFVKRGQK